MRNDSNSKKAKSNSVITIILSIIVLILFIWIIVLSKSNLTNYKMGLSVGRTIGTAETFSTDNADEIISKYYELQSANNMPKVQQLTDELIDILTETDD